MLPDALPQLVDTLLRLPLLDAAQLRELIQHLPDPQAAAQEMVRRGWITQDQFSSLFPGPQQQPTPRETILVGFGDDEIPSDADSDDWDLPLSDEEDKSDVPALVVSGAGTPQFEGEVLASPVAGGNEARGWMGWASIGLLMGTFFLGSFFAARPFFGAKSTVPPVARQDSREANAGAPARAVDLPTKTQIVPVNNVKQPEDLRSLYARVSQVIQTQSRDANCSPSRQTVLRSPMAPPARANDAKPQSTASLYGADGSRYQSSRINPKQNDASQFRVGQAVWVEWGGRWWDARILKAENGWYYVTYPSFGSEWDEWVGPARIRAAALDGI